METDKDPTFAEALLALAIAERNWHNGAAIGDAWEAGVTDAAKFVSGPSLMTYAPPSILRALGADKQMSEPYDGLPIGHLISLIASAKRGDPIQQADVDALEEWRSTRSPVVDKQPVIEPRELALEKQLADAQQDARDATTMIAQAHREKAAAVARAEKAEAQAAEARAAKADVMAANLRARTAQDERDALKAKLATAEKRAEEYGNDFAKVFAERDALAAKLAEKEATRVRIYNELIAYQHERDRLAGIADRAGRILDEAAARKPLDAKEQS